MNSMRIDDLNLVPFQHFNLCVPPHSFIMIAGSNRSGKTQLIKILGGLIPTDTTVVFHKAYLESYATQEVYQKIHVFLGNDKWHFIFKTVEEELRFPLENLGFSTKEINKKLTDIMTIFSLDKVMRLDPNHLNKYLKVKVLLALQLISEPEVLLLDDPTKMLTKQQRQEILALLNYYQTKGMTIIMTTSTLDDALTAKASKLYILHKGKIVLEGAIYDVLKEDSLLSKVGLRLPFMVDLSVKLKYYNLIDDIVLDPESLVNQLWK